MVRIRLKRTGTRNAVCFRVVVMDQRSSRDGKAIEELGFYNPRTKEAIQIPASTQPVFKASKTLKDLVSK